MLFYSKVLTRLSATRAEFAPEGGVARGRVEGTEAGCNHRLGMSFWKLHAPAGGSRLGGVAGWGESPVYILGQSVTAARLQIMKWTQGLHKTASTASRITNAFLS